MCIRDRGEIKKDQIKWSTYGWQGGFSSPVLDGERLYQVDNGANIAAFDVNTGKQLWLKNLGTIQKASPVFADGKLYVGTENGKFYILKPSATGCEILDEDQLGTEEQPEAIVGSAAVSNGRVYFASDSGLYAIGKKTTHSSSQTNANAVGSPVSSQTATHVQVVPTELILKPGDKANFRVRLFDAQGNFIREESEVAWSLDQLKGTIENGHFTASSDAVAQGGLVKATVAGISGTASVRVFPPIPWSENFDS